MMQKNSNAPLPIQVVLADDHDLVRSGIKALLSTVEGVQVIAEARNGNELLALLEQGVAILPLVAAILQALPELHTVAEVGERVVAHAEAPVDSCHYRAIPNRPPPSSPSALASGLFWPRRSALLASASPAF